MGCEIYKSTVLTTISIPEDIQIEVHGAGRCRFLRIEIGGALTTFAEVISRGKFPLKRVQTKSTVTVTHHLSFPINIHGVVVWAICEIASPGPGIGFSQRLPIMVRPCVFCRCWCWCWCCPNTHQLVRLLRLDTSHMIIHATSGSWKGICSTRSHRWLLGDLGRHGHRRGRRGEVCRGCWVLSCGVTRGRLRGRKVIRRGMALSADRHQRRRRRGLRSLLSLLIRRKVRRMMGLFQEPGGRRSRRRWSNCK